MIIAFSDLIVEIEPTVLKTLKQYEQTKHRNESGGILLGKYCLEDERYIITAVTEPSFKDFCGRLWFIRNRDNAQIIINKMWKESGGYVNYLGEWHTHPWEFPRPSYIDKNLMRSIIKDGSNVWKHLFMIIVGLNDTFYIGVCDAEHKGKIVNEKVIGEYTCINTL